MPIVTLTTDFGEGSYVAQVKGVILSLAPETRIVDVTHEVAPPHFQSMVTHPPRLICGGDTEKLWMIGLSGGGGGSTWRPTTWTTCFARLVPLGPLALTA